MKAKKILFVIFPSICLSGCHIFNGVKEFGDARVTADYFLKDYTDFFYYGGKDYVCVARCSSKVSKGEYVSAINGKKCSSYRFYSFANYNESNYLVVNIYNKVFKVDEDYFYASLDAPSIPFNFLDFSYRTQDPGSINVGSNCYIYYDDSVQTIEKGNEVLNKNGTLYYEVKDYPKWIMTTKDDVTKLFYLRNIETFDVHMAWFAKDITVK